MPARVLIADDDALVRRLLRLTLEAHGALQVVGEAADGAEAVALARTLAPDIVVLDVAMPELNGFEVAARVRPALPGCAILIFSAGDAASHEARALGAGADRYLEKSAGVGAVAQAALTAAAAG